MNYTVYNDKFFSELWGILYSAHNFYRSQIFFIPKNPLPCILHLIQYMHACFPKIPHFEDALGLQAVFGEIIAPYFHIFNQI
jgi:hypothetical protein